MLKPPIAQPVSHDTEHAADAAPTLNQRADELAKRLADAHQVPFSAHAFQHRVALLKARLTDEASLSQFERGLATWLDRLTAVAAKHRASLDALYELGIWHPSGRAASPKHGAAREKSTKRRLRVLRFIAERTVPVCNLSADLLDAPHHLVSWQRLSGEWNRRHQGDRMAQESLRVLYCRAKADTTVCSLFFTALDRQMGRALTDVGGIALEVFDDTDGQVAPYVESGALSTDEGAEAVLTILRLSYCGNRPRERARNARSWNAYLQELPTRTRSDYLWAHAMYWFLCDRFSDGPLRAIPTVTADDLWRSA